MNLLYSTIRLYLYYYRSLAEFKEGLEFANNAFNAFIQTPLGQRVMLAILGMLVGYIIGSPLENTYNKLWRWLPAIFLSFSAFLAGPETLSAYLGITIGTGSMLYILAVIIMVYGIFGVFKSEASLTKKVTILSLTLIIASYLLSLIFPAYSPLFYLVLMIAVIVFIFSGLLLIISHFSGGGGGRSVFSSSNRAIKKEMKDLTEDKTKTNEVLKEEEEEEKTAAKEEKTTYEELKNIEEVKRIFNHTINKALNEIEQKKNNIQNVIIASYWFTKSKKELVKKELIEIIEILKKLKKYLNHIKEFFEKLKREEHYKEQLLRKMIKDETRIKSTVNRICEHIIRDDRFFEQLIHKLLSSSSLRKLNELDEEERKKVIKHLKTLIQNNKDHFRRAIEDILKKEKIINRLLEEIKKSEYKLQSDLRKEKQLLTSIVSEIERINDIPIKNLIEDLEKTIKGKIGRRNVQIAINLIEGRITNIRKYIKKIEELINDLERSLEEELQTDQMMLNIIKAIVNLEKNIWDDLINDYANIRKLHNMLNKEVEEIKKN